jgi:acetyltransferase-like isoleucine patch superfamily enzyme
VDETGSVVKAMSEQRAEAGNPFAPQASPADRRYPDMTMSEDLRLIDEVDFGAGVVVRPFTNLYGCRIGDRTRIGTFVEVQRGAEIGADCKIQSHTFICDGVTIGDQVFVGHGVVFVNDKRPRATNLHGLLQGESDWLKLSTVVEERASIGSGATILGGITIGADSTVGAGAVVTRDVPPGATVVGNPARELG